MRNLMIRIGAAVIGLAAGLLVLVPATTHAEGISLTTSPVFLSTVVRPGTSVTRTLQLMNNSSQPVKIDMQLDVFSANGATGEPTITEPSSNDPSPKWVSFSPSSFVAQPGVWSKVQMTINLPKSAELGYYYAVLFKPDIPDQPSAKATVIRGTNAIMVLVDTQSGNEQRAIDVTDFKVSQGLFEYLPATFTVGIRNGGNIYLSPTGSVYISRDKDVANSMAAIDINPGGGNILPRSSRDFTVSWSDGFPLFVDKTIDGQVVRDKNGNPVKELSWDFAKFSKIRFGQYYAKVTLVYNDGQRVVPISRIVSFWVIPWKLILAIILMLAVLIIGLSTIGRFTFHVMQGAGLRVYRRR